ncbi:Apolipoprotein D [Papilio machaon]|uniref:Apolipoprotein D n=1 Tax=Papilio machaon TaxID=76193 RepID=A0A194QSM1_PAPMA|nr:Apolipoprotein D [Papilio machaon]
MGDFRTCAATTLYLLLLASVARHVLPTGLGQCPTFGQLQNFDIDKMVGKWYEVERSFYLMELSASCTELRVTLNDRGQLNIVIYTRNRWTCTHCMTRGVGVLSHKGASSFRYRVNKRVPYLIGRMLPGAGQYSILATDYDQFALIWSCTGLSVAHSGTRRQSSKRPHKFAEMAKQPLPIDIRNCRCVAYPQSTKEETHKKRIFNLPMHLLLHQIDLPFPSLPYRMWVLGRKREIDAQLRAYIYNLLNGFGLDPDRLILSKNNDCPDYDKNTTITD